MLSIRAQQIDAFDSVDAPDFPPRMIRHLQDAFPKHCRCLGEDGIREVVDYGIHKGRGYGFARQSSGSLFIDLTLLLGRSFHDDAQLPWASVILRDIAFTNELAKAQRLHAAACEYLNSVSGPANEYIDAAQRRLLHESIAITAGSVADFIGEALIRFARIWPEKYERVGERDLRVMIESSISDARGYAIASAPGILVYLGIAYMLGSGFDRDPLCSWAQDVLADTDERDQSVRARRLHAGALTYLQQWCA